MRLGGKVALVTGGARGIGRAIALRLAREGADVAVADLNLEGARAVAAEAQALGRTARAYRIDVADPPAAAAVIEQAAADFGKLDVLVNNAGVLEVRSFLDLSPDVWDRTLSINARGVFFCTQAAARVMIPRKQGRIINIASIAARTNSPPLIDYCASKAAVVSITQSCAKALAPHGINVNAISPGIVDTPMWEQLDSDWSELEGREQGAMWKHWVSLIPLGRAQVPDDVAAAAAFLASADADYITGQNLPVEGGLVMI